MATSSTAAGPLAGRTAIITGASRGLGREVAVHLAALGANVVINYTSPSSAAAADALAAEINSTQPFPRATTLRGDIADPAAVGALFDHAEQTFDQKAHILVNCAGVLDDKYHALAETLDSDWDRTFAVNAKGAFLLSREAANRLVRGGGGRIIMFSSSTVGGVPPGFGAYTASKAAVETMVRILAKELKGTKITANCVAPGPIATEMFFAGKTEETVRRVVEASPMGRLGETADVSPVVGFLAGDSSEWVNGQTIRVNGGYV